MSLLRPRPVLNMQGLELNMQELLTWAPLKHRETLQTEDAGRAAEWLQQQFGGKFPTINLSLLGARLVGAQAFLGERRALLSYRGPQGERVTLVIFPDAPRVPTDLRSMTYRGRAFRVLEAASSRGTLLAWEAEGRTFVVAGPLSPDALLPYAHEIDRNCQ